jgi:hypothetical protein|nr:MAG TPA: HeH/LEM domain [Caudoviricetes sp.]
MAFVKVRKAIGKRFDGKPIKVSSKAYENIFKKKGYVLVDDDGNRIEKENDYSQNKMLNESDFGEEEVQQKVDEIPISEMNSAQLKQFAKEHDIDTSSASNVKEARRIIQKAVREGNV